MIAFIDNKDSFVWNIVEYISIIDENVGVFSNETSVRELKNIDPDAIIISPGPGTPYRKRDIGNSIEIIREFDLPILGICLGHQAMGVAFGGKVEKIEPRHGKKTSVHHDGKRAFEGIENPFLGGRYHSLAVTEVPESFEVSATSNGVVMGMRHRKKDIEGFQFHPESILTKSGFDILKNWYEFYVK
ncbi:MAG: aminodeoxychorismate/anthranilate synthase component II [Candidatus Methanolliviera hydrocarbonicum]|uniref:anthranilate synthase n=1 Tax=Candidatus Methanolliviera hydrocarbonicum TaxID=2491085 RepID=A0A520KW56_9EURY|nr:MAG: aminodeoxychorismate/anthranilate synthase component II [Candidatus Methanolliviera hydrocarbonicum]